MLCSQLTYVSTVLSPTDKQLESIQTTINNFVEDPPNSEVSLLDVVEHELQKDKYNNMVLAGGTSDVSALHTKGKVNIQSLREVAIYTAQQTVRIAEAALQEYPGLNKVVIVRTSPRFDLDTDDPFHLKPQLAQLMDSVYFGLWGKSQFKE